MQIITENKPDMMTLAIGGRIVARSFLGPKALFIEMKGIVWFCNNGAVQYGMTQAVFQNALDNGELATPKEHATQPSKPQNKTVANIPGWKQDINEFRTLLQDY